MHAARLAQPTPEIEPAPRQPRPPRRTRRLDLLAPELVRAALKQAVIMLRPDIQWANPVMFVVEVGALLTLLFVVKALFAGSASQVPVSYFIALDAWLFLTVLFANFATALAEARGKAQAESLRRTRRDTPAYRLRTNNTIEEVSSVVLKPGDRIVVEAGQIIPGDGEIIEGMASVDESAITGESAPVIRESGGDRSGVTGGTIVLSDRIVVRITAAAGESFLDRMIALVEGAIRQRTPNEIALTLVLSAFTLIFLIVVVPLWPMAWNAEQYMMGYLSIPQPVKSLGTDVPTLVALLVCLIPTTIGALLAAIGIAGMDRALQANIIAKSGRAVETAGDIDVVMLDKTGTITVGNRHATKFLPVGGYADTELAQVAALASLADETPEGKSIVKLARELNGAVGALAAPRGSEFVSFSAQTRMTRGSLTTFSIANDVAKYFAIVPALFAGTLPWLKHMDIMHLDSPTSAILSAVIFNAIIIPALIPIALRGVEYKPMGADALLRRNIMIWGVGGIIVPFVGIKLIDLIMTVLHLAA